MTDLCFSSDLSFCSHSDKIVKNYFSGPQGVMRSCWDLQCWLIEYELSNLKGSYPKMPGTSLWHAVWAAWSVYYNINRHVRCALHSCALMWQQFSGCSWQKCLVVHPHSTQGTHSMAAVWTNLLPASSSSSQHLPLVSPPLPTQLFWRNCLDFHSAPFILGTAQTILNLNCASVKGVGNIISKCFAEEQQKAK